MENTNIHVEDSVVGSGDDNALENIKKMLNHINVSTKNERKLINSTLKLINAKCKLKYLKECKNLNKIPIHILKNTQNIDSLFYSEYLNLYKHKLMSRNICIQILNESSCQSFKRYGRAYCEF